MDEKELCDAVDAISAAAENTFLGVEARKEAAEALDRLEADNRRLYQEVYRLQAEVARLEADNHELSSYISLRDHGMPLEDDADEKEGMS